MAIVGLTCTWLNYNVAGAFIAQETTESYTWAMQQLKKLMVKVQKEPVCLVTDRELALMNACLTVFPSSTTLLCRRHVKKNIEDYARKVTSNQGTGTVFANTYYHLFKKNTVEKYEKELRKITTEWKGYPTMIKYVNDRWLSPYKEKIVSAWTDKVFNLGQNTTNRYSSSSSSSSP